MTIYTDNKINDTIIPEFGNVYLAEHCGGDVDYVLFCSEAGNKKFVHLKTGIIVPADVFIKYNKLIKHIDEVVFKY